MVFLVDDPPSGRHPLDVSGLNNAGSSGTVVVFDFALKGNRDGLESAVRVLADAERLRVFAARFEQLRLRVVEHEKRADRLRKRLVGKNRVHLEAVPHPVRRRSRQNLLHGSVLHLAVVAAVLVTGIGVARCRCRRCCCRR